MDKNEYQTTRIWSKSLGRLKLIASLTNESIVEVIDRLSQQEWKRHEERANIMSTTVSNLQDQYAERERREKAMEEKYPDAPSTVAEDIQQMQEFGLYCGTCGHGNGCEHGVPASRW